MGKASSNKKASVKKLRIPDAGSSEFSGNLHKKGLLQKPVVHILLIIALGSLAYSNTFHSPFQWDEVAQILQNPIIKDLHNFTSSTKGYEYASSYYNPRRSIGYLTFALNYHFGGLNVTGYHLVNLLIHIINGILVYFLVVLTFRTPYFSVSGTSNQGSGTGILTPAPGFPVLPVTNPQFQIPKLIALFSALLFISHPVQTQAVTYVVQRFTSLATLFYLASVVFYVIGRLTSGQTGKPASRKAIKLGTFCLSLLFALLAIKTKEITFTLPLVIIIYEFTFFKSSLRRKLLFLLPVLLTLIIVSISVLNSDKSLGEMLSDVSESTRLQTSMPRWDYLMTQMRVITTYIRLIFLPINQNLDYDYPIEHSFFTPPVFFSFLFLSAIFGTALYLLSLSRQKSKGEEQGEIVPSTGHYSLLTIHLSKFIAFGILWFFITLAIESSLIPIKDVIFEHRMYLPSVGLFSAIAAGVFLAAQRLRMEKIAISVLVLTTLIFSGVTYARNTVWMSKTAFWEDITKKSPNKPRVHNNLGAIYFSQGRMEDALREFQLALMIKPDFAEAHNNLGSVYAAQGLMDKASREFQSALSFSPDYADAHYNLGKFYFASGQMNEAIREFQAAIELKPDHADSHNNLGAVYETLGRVDEAIREYQTALQIDPGNVPARNNLGRHNKMAGDRN